MNPFAQSNYLKNYFYLLCGPTPPKTIDYRMRIPEDFYLNMTTVEKELRRTQIFSGLNENLIPIPSQYFFDQILKRNLKNNERFVDEFKVNF